MCQTAITICRGLSHMTGWAALPSENILQLCFHGAEKPSEDINIHLFWMNEKGLMQCNVTCYFDIYKATAEEFYSNNPTVW